MNRLLQWILTVVTSAVVVLGMAGCKGPNANHQRWVGQATERWHAMRSTQMLAMAEKRFETGDLKEAQKIVQEAMSVDQKNPQLYVLAGRIMLERGQLERSYHLFNVAAELDPSLPETYYFTGLVLQRWQRMEDALASYQKAYDLRPDEAPYLLPICEMLVALDRTGEAISLLEDKLNYFEANAAIRAALGQMYLISGDVVKAADAYKQASLLRPDDMQLLEKLALTQLAAGESQAAGERLARLCDDPAMKDRTDLQMALADAYRAQGRTLDARRVYLGITRDHPKNAVAWSQLAEVSWIDRDDAAAMTAAQRAVSVDPQAGDAYMIIGLVLRKRGHTSDAVRAFAQASKLEPDNASSEILRGMALQELGEIKQARQAYQQALARQPEDQRARQLLAAVGTE